MDRNLGALLEGGSARIGEFSYADYQDWNNPLNRIEAHYAGRMIERRGGEVVWTNREDLVTTCCEVYELEDITTQIRH